MIVINLPQAPSVSLPPEPRAVPNPGARRLSRRAQSLAVAQLSSADPLTGAPLDNRKTDLKALKYDVPNDVVIPTFAESSRDVDRDLARLYEAVSGARRIAVVCGAGISVSSPANIPDFRSAHGLFKKLKEKHPTAGLSSGKDLFDARLFSSESTSSLFYSMVAELKRLADEAEPTIFHRLLKRLDDEGRLQRVYTQNIDGLEEKAGLTFGLGEAGDATTTVRALGKRKRFGEARSKSDSHVLFAQKQEVAPQRPMFPRTIPLHGTLQTLTCALCSHKVVLGNTVHRDRVASSSREGSVALGHEESVHALQLLQSGEAVPCPRCETADEVRTTAGMRSRGVGRMKVDIVLYGGQNEGAERVGQCLQRDILGLRDPHEPSVPESASETRARERKEKKEAATALQPVPEAGDVLLAEDSKDDILARAFANDDDVPAKKKAPRPARLKPLPPDLLIVAGTSLKVPGTKRIVREFAKACHAQDEWLIYSSDDESSADDTRRPKRAARRDPSPSPSPEAEDNELHDPNTPIRSILLNYDFPNPAREWEDVFDVWIQGDLQRAALSLFPAKDAKVGAIERIVGQHTWSKHTPYLEEQRKAAKKNGKKSGTSTPLGTQIGDRKGKLGRTVSAAATMERVSSASSTKPTSARGRSESPTKKQPRTSATGLKRMASKKGPFEGGKGHDGGNNTLRQPRGKKEVSPSSSLAPTPSLCSRATSASSDEADPVLAEHPNRLPFRSNRGQHKRTASLKDLAHLRLDDWRARA